MKIKLVMAATVGLIAAVGIQSALYAPPTIAKTVAEQTANRVYKRANPAVVTVRVGARSHGSGFIISQNGLVITNAHVAAGAPSVVTLMMADGKTELPADVVGFARNGVDLAILKIGGKRKLPSIKLANSKSLAVGDQVYAIGTPLAEANQSTFTMGIVSALRKGGTIQHSAAINGGNSGGPLLNSDGDVIGVNTSIGVAGVECADGSTCARSTGNVGIAYAVSVNTVKAFLADIKAGRISPVSTLKD